MYYLFNLGELLSKTIKKAEPLVIWLRLFSTLLHVYFIYSKRIERVKIFVIQEAFSGVGVFCS